MNDSLQGVFAIAILFWLVSMLYVGPTYFRRLGSLIEHVKEKHEDVYEILGRPSFSMMDTTTRGQIGILKFILRKEYLSLEDQVATELAEEVRWRLAFCVIGFFLLTAGMLFGEFD